MPLPLRSTDVGHVCGSAVSLEKEPQGELTKISRNGVVHYGKYQCLYGLWFLHQINSLD